jgi:hypothetical protein
MTLAGTSMILPRMVSLPSRLWASYLQQRLLRSSRGCLFSHKGDAPMAAAEGEVVGLRRVDRIPHAQDLDGRELVAALRRDEL